MLSVRISWLAAFEHCIFNRCTYRVVVLYHTQDCHFGIMANFSRQFFVTVVQQRQLLCPSQDNVSFKDHACLLSCTDSFVLSVWLSGRSWRPQQVPHQWM